MTSYDLAERLGIGQATVVRFSKKLGYRMFGEMIDDAKNSVGESTSEIIESDTPSDILDKLEKRTCDIIQSIRQSNDAECFARAAKLIDGARNIVCYGYTTSNLFASYLCELLIEIGKGALCESNANLTKRRVFQLDSERDVVIIVSKSGEKSESVGIAEYAKSRGIPVIAISNAGKSPLVEIADVHIKVLEISDRSVPSASMGRMPGSSMRPRCSLHACSSATRRCIVGSMATTSSPHSRSENRVWTRLDGAGRASVLLKPATWVAPVVGLDRDAIREVPIPCRDAVFPICPFEVWGIGILAGNQTGCPSLPPMVGAAGLEPARVPHVLLGTRVCRFRHTPLRYNQIG